MLSFKSLSPNVSLRPPVAAHCFAGPVLCAARPPSTTDAAATLSPSTSASSAVTRRRTPLLPSNFTGFEVV
ncbi:unnamed protein product, partial [Citrullus colocynthis]